jgi:hypothetical protein
MQDTGATASAAHDRSSISTCSTSSSSTHVLDLDLHVLAQVLRHLPPQENMRCCSLVCKTWHAAAVHTVVEEITIGSEPTNTWHAQHFANDHRASFTDWLCKYGKGAQLLHIIDSGSSSSRLVWQLPLGLLLQLQDLKAVNCSLQPVQASSNSACQAAAAAGGTAQSTRQRQGMLLPYADSSSSSVYKNSIATLSSLRSLCLQNVEIRFSGGMNSLSALTGLQHLQLEGVDLRYLPQQQHSNQQQRQQQQQPEPCSQLLGGLSGLGALTQLQSLYHCLVLLAVHSSSSSSSSKMTNSAFSCR